MSAVFLHFYHLVSTALQICPKFALPWPPGHVAVLLLPTFFPQVTVSAVADELLDFGP